MTTEQLDVKTIFDHSLEIASPAERLAYLDQVCATVLAPAP